MLGGRCRKEEKQVPRRRKMKDRKQMGLLGVPLCHKRL